MVIRYPLSDTPEARLLKGELTEAALLSGRQAVLYPFYSGASALESAHLEVGECSIKRRVYSRRSNSDYSSSEHASSVSISSGDLHLSGGGKLPVAMHKSTSPQPFIFSSLHPLSVHVQRVGRMDRHQL